MISKKVLSKAVEIYLLFFATFHLLYFGFDGYSHIFEAKLVTFFTSNAILFILFIFFSFYARYEQTDDIPSTQRQQFLSPSHICVAFYLLFTVISAVFSKQFPDTIMGVSRYEGLLTIATYCFTFFAISLIPCTKKYILIAFAFAVTLFSVLCIIQIFSFNPFSMYPDGTNFYDAGVKYTTAFIGTIGNANLSGAFICLALPLLAVFLIKAKSKIRFLLIIPVLMLLFVVAKMNVDSTILGLASTAVITLPLIFGFNKKATIVYFCILLLLFAAFIFVLYQYPPQSGFLNEASEILHGNISETFGSGRIRIWKNVISKIPDSPIIGKGPDTMKREGFEPFSRYYPALGKVKTAGIDVAHNEFLNILYHQGVLGLFAYLGFIFFVLKSFIRGRKNPLILALGVAFICYLIQSLFTFSMCLVAPYFWICAGLIVGVERSFNNEKTTLE